MPPTSSGCPAFLRGFPGAVLEVSPDGVVLSSNGQLERVLDRPLVGHRVVEMLDRASSQPKWERILAGEGADGAVVWELILLTPGSLSEPLAFSSIRDPETGTLWLVQHPRDPRLDQLSREVTAVNSELALTQRELSKERARLASALEALELRREELEHRNRELDEFAYVVSHDLKAPLRAIAGYAHWLEHDLGEQLRGETREYLEGLRRRVVHLEGMINGILQYSRAGRTEAARVRVDVEELVREVVELLRPPPSAQIIVEPGLPELVTERLLLEQVFLNLLSNALKYTQRPDPVVRVGGREAGEFFQFHVADNGPGIAPRVQERIWTIFFTGQPDNDPNATGIGLAVVKRLVEGHGGRVWVESEPGEGATFFFLWPRDAQAGS